MVQTLHALVVDDEASVRRLTIRALEECHFTCDEAANGEQAAELLGSRSYDVVVTDLCMPKRNGHSLAVEVLKRGVDRPLVVVLTGVLEPRIAADLIARGVDDITFKPVNFSMFAAKVEAICNRRRDQSVVLCKPASPSPSSSYPELAPISIKHIEQRLDSLAGSLPVSSAAIEIVNLVQNGSPSIEEVARVIARDPLLTVEVLRLANSANYNPGAKRIEDVQRAIAIVGDRQIGELAMASTTMHALTRTTLPWIDPEVTWRRSLANSLVIKQLHSVAELGAEDEGLFLSAMLLPMARVLMGLAFPDHYEQMIVHCRETGSSLASVERRFLPIAPSLAMAGMLARWKLSPRLFKPLQYAHHSYKDLTSLTEPLRSKVERLRVAELLGWIAVGRFDMWDEVEFPSAETMCRLRAEDLGRILDDARTESNPHPDDTYSRDGMTAGQEGLEIDYYKLSLEPHDFLASLFGAMKIKLDRVSREVACQSGAALVNGLDVSPERMEWFVDDAIPNSSRSLFCNSCLPPHHEAWGPVVRLPSSFATLVKAIPAVPLGTALT